jgi:DNA-binding IclR family transcriptional regulator
MNKKEKILDFLRRGEAPTAAIADYIGSNFYLASRLLEELEADGKIERCSDDRRGTYWRLKR